MEDTSPEQSSHEDEKINRLSRAMYSRSLSENLQDRPRRVLRLDAPPVREEWEEKEEGAPLSTIAPRRIGASRFFLKVLLWGSVAFFVGAAGFFGYYFTLGGGSSTASPGNIDIIVSGPSRISSGARTDLQVSVVNRNQAPLEYADLVITYPSGTRSATDFQTDRPSERIPLNSIEPGGRRQGSVTAVFAGTEGAHGTVKVELEYRLEGSSAIFVASSGYGFTYASSPLAISISGNSETVSGQPVELEVTLSSNAEGPLKDVLLSAEYPFGFSLSSSEPTPLSTQGDVWVLGDFRPGEKKTVTVRGVLAGESGDERVFNFIAGTRKTASATQVQDVLADYAHHMLVSRPFLGLSVALNKDTGGGAAVAGPNETVSASIAYQNNLPTAITDVVIVARLTGLPIDGATVRSSDGFYRSSDASVLWDKTTTSGALENLAPGAKGTVNFSFQVPDSAALEAIRNPELDIAVYAAGKRVSESGVPQNLQATARKNVKIASDLKVTAQGLYYTNPLGSTGPLPPKADQETTYAVVFSITNTTNRVENAKLSMALPPYVRWLGVCAPLSECGAGASNVAFDAVNGTLTLDLKAIEAGTGVGGVNQRHVTVTIGFTPSTSQIGQQPVLVRDITLSGRDELGGSVSKKAPDVTTNIVGDPGFSAANATVVR